MQPNPDEALRLYLEALYGRDRERMIEIAHQRETASGKGPMHRGRSGIFRPASDLGAVAREIRELAEWDHVWVGVTPRQPDQDGVIGGRRENVAPAKVLWADVDLKDRPDALERLRAFRPRPHLVVSSGGGYHAYWLVEEQLDADELHRANKRIAHALGADMQATEPARILRPPGTSNYKAAYGNPRPVELRYFGDDPPYQAAHVVAALADPPERRRAPAAALHDRGGDPLQRFAPADYFQLLAGVEPDREGKVCCPLPAHDDPEPSCHVYETAAQGWYCFGCDRGGDIYELAGGMWGLDTHSREFREIRQRLDDELGVERDDEAPPGRTPPRPREDLTPPPTPAGPGLRAAAPIDVPAATALAEPPAEPDVAPDPAALREPEPGRGATIAPPRPSELEPPDEPRRQRGGLRPSRALEPIAAVIGWKVILIAAAVLAALLLCVFVILVFAALGGGFQPQGDAELVCGASGEAKETIPAEYLKLYQDAAQTYGEGSLDWAILAAIGVVETNHGHSTLPGVHSGANPWGAAGPMQFGIGGAAGNTWGAYGVDGNGDGARNVYDPEDAIPAAGNYLRANYRVAQGSEHARLRRAIWAYNHAPWYVDKVLAQAERYRGECREREGDAQPITDDYIGGTGRLAWPVNGPVVSPFGQRWGRLHAGIDIAAPAGRPIHAAAPGRVTLAGPVSGYGNFVCVQHRRTLSTCYAHLSAYRTRVGEELQRGEIVGLVGCTGHCFGDHLHFEVRLGTNLAGRPVNPIPLLGARQ